MYVYFNVNFYVFFKINKSAFVGDELYIYQNARCNDKNKKKNTFCKLICARKYVDFFFLNP